MIKIAPGLSNLWANLIINGSKKYSDVPPKLKKEVTEILQQLGRSDLTK